VSSFQIYFTLFGLGMVMLYSRGQAKSTNLISWEGMNIFAI